MSNDLSTLESDISAKRHKMRLIPVKGSGPAIGKEPYGLEQFLTRTMPPGKRLFDILGAILGIIFSVPLIMAITIAIKLTSKGPVFFIQERTGQNLKRFRMYKFRTMEVGSSKNFNAIRSFNEMTGPLIKMNNDPRLTKIGLFLRKSSLDELPQLFNVLKGDMTIIGPRALSPLPSEYESWQRRRFTVKPGLACIWQAEQRDGTDFVEWMRSDLHYVDTADFLMDFCVFLKTIWTVFTCRGGR